MKIIRKPGITALIYLLFSGIILIFYNCENQTNPADPPKVQWVVDSTLIPEIISKVDSNHIRNTIQTLQDFETRYAYSPKCYEAAQWIKSQLESYGYVVEDQPFQHYLFYDIIFVNESNAWIAGNYGLILRSGDGGVTWLKQESPTNIHLRKVFFIDETNGWAGGDSTLLKTTNGGQSWQTIEDIPGDKVYDIFFLNESVGWVCTDNALYHTPDGGNTWSTIYSEESHNVYFLTDSIGFLCITKSLQKTTDAGLTWNEVFTITGKWDSLWDIDFYNNQIGMVVSDNGDVFLSKDGGEEWEGQKIDEGSNFNRCLIVSSDFFIILSGKIYKTYNGGNTWEKEDITVPGEYIQSIDFKNDQEGIVVGGSFFKTSKDMGKTWSEISIEAMDETVLLHNIKATKKGKINSDDRIVIGAHYDAITSVYGLGSMDVAPGANDNASGTAGVLEMAHVMNEYEFDISLDFILFSGEEPPPTLMGSKYAAAKSASENENITEMINFDMIGYCPDDIFNVQIHSPNANHRTDFIYRASIYSDLIIYENDTHISDAKSYGENGFIALSVSEYTFPSLRDYPWYHSSEDKINKLNIRFSTEVVKFTLSGVCLKTLPVIAK